MVSMIIASLRITLIYYSIIANSPSQLLSFFPNCHIQETERGEGGRGRDGRILKEVGKIQSGRKKKYGGKGKQT